MLVQPLPHSLRDQPQRAFLRRQRMIKRSTSASSVKDCRSTSSATWQRRMRSIRWLSAAMVSGHRLQGLRTKGDQSLAEWSGATNLLEQDPDEVKGRELRLPCRESIPADLPFQAAEVELSCR